LLQLFKGCDNTCIVTHIAIDGSVASGKGTIARELSRRLSIPCLDTGAMYRGVGIYINEHGIDKLSQMKMDARIENGITRIFLDGKDVTGQLRENHVSRLASHAATIPAVRAICIAKAREIAKNQSLIMEGRDICNVCLPDAKYKFLITASVRVRARRRFNELIAKGENITFKEALRQTKWRDRRDRKNGGFKKVKGAIVIDNSGFAIRSKSRRRQNNSIADECSINHAKRDIDRVVTHMLGYIST